MMQNGMKADIKIQSISDIITNSSTEIFTLYSRKNKEDIINLVNAILAISGEYTFDDLFTIHMYINTYASRMLYKQYKEISNKFYDEEEFNSYLETLSDDKLKKYEDMLEEIIDCYDPVTLYDGYSVKLKPDIVETEALKKAKYAINDINQIFEYDYGKY